jgi:hypothetical protein
MAGLLKKYIKILLEATDYAFDKGSTFDYKNKSYYVSDLIKIMKDHDKYPIEEMSVSELVNKTRDEDPWTWEGKLTFGDYIDHYDRAINADFKFPIILSPDNKILDGNHRLLKAYIEKKDKIKVQYCHDINKDSCKLQERE